MPDKSYLLVLALAVILWLGVIAMLVFPIQPTFTASIVNFSETPNVNVTLYMSELSQNVYGFGLDPQNLTSPGPTLHFKVADVVNLTVINVGHRPHTLILTNTLRNDAPILFNAVIGTANKPLQPGQTGSTVFTVNVVSDPMYGIYFYASAIPGEAGDFGMYGSITISAWS